MDRYDLVEYLVKLKFLSLVHKIKIRHNFLEATITERQDEEKAYDTAKYLDNCLTPIFLTLLFLETASYFVYLNQVKNVHHKLTELVFLFV